MSDLIKDSVDVKVDEVVQPAEEGARPDMEDDREGVERVVE